MPRNQKVVITDTVGFIKDLPKDLLGGFRPTFDELRESDLLIHLIDLSHPRFPEHIESVEKILIDLKLEMIPRVRVFNKEDKLSREEAEAICQKHDGVCISALRPESLEKFFDAVDKKLWEMDRARHREGHLPHETDDETDNVVLTNQDPFDISTHNWIMEVRPTDGKPSY